MLEVVEKQLAKNVHTSQMTISQDTFFVFRDTKLTQLTNPNIFCKYSHKTPFNPLRSHPALH